MNIKQNGITCFVHPFPCAYRKLLCSAGLEKMSLRVIKPGERTRQIKC